MFFLWCEDVKVGTLEFALYYGWATHVIKSPRKFLWTVFGDTKDILLVLLLVVVVVVVEDQHHRTQ
jgi:hypothetical protein